MSEGTSPDDSAYEYGAFSGYGIEIEHMLVDRDSLDVAPVADRLLALAGTADDMDVLREGAAWSNELALHVIESKTLGPVSDLDAAGSTFRRQVDDMNALVAEWGVCLMPTAMHPWMDPDRETRLWPHQNDEIYAAFDRIFGCRGHGWSNLQSVHINFPFSTEEEFRRVHAACRFVLPLVPALAASSPFVEGRRAPVLDARLLAYQDNCARVPSISGEVVPEPIESYAGYRKLLEGIYRDLAPHDKEGVLAHEWVNARGVITRFDRGACELRLMDTQECPERDLSLVRFFVALVRGLAEGRFGTDPAELNGLEQKHLRLLLDRAILEGGKASLEVSGARHDFGEVFGCRTKTMENLLAFLVESLSEDLGTVRGDLESIVENGNLAQRIVRRLPEEAPGRTKLKAVYEELCHCLETGNGFE